MLLSQFIEQLAKSLGRSSESIQSPDHDAVEFSHSENIEELGHAGAMHCPSRECVLEPLDLGIIGYHPSLKVRKLARMLLVSV